MKFRNPANGYIEDKTAPWLWCFLFGMFYFLYTGIFSHAFVMFVVSAFLFANMGGPAVILIIFMQLLYCFAASSVVANHYLGKGWVLVDDSIVNLPVDTTETPKNGNVETQMNEVNELHENKTCPFCAEEIKFKAVVCKHCGKDQPIEVDKQ